MLQPSEIENRKKINLKILKFGCLPIFIIFGLLIYTFTRGVAVTSNEKKTYVKKEIAIDTIINHIKKDTNYVIKEVFYKDIDSTLNIVIANNGTIEKNELFGTDYFALKYDLYDLKQIQKIVIYDFKKRASIDDYKNSLTSDTRKFYKKRVEFYEKYSSVYGWFIPVERYLEYNLDDPAIKFARSSTILGINTDKTFRTRSVYRAKNKNGGLVLYTIYCDIDMKGNVSNAIITEGIN